MGSRLVCYFVHVLTAAPSHDFTVNDSNEEKGRSRRALLLMDRRLLGNCRTWPIDN